MESKYTQETFAISEDTIVDTDYKNHDYTDLYPTPDECEIDFETDGNLSKIDMSMDSEIQQQSPTSMKQHQNQC